MAIFKKPNYFDIGSNGTPDAFLKAFAKVSGYHDREKSAALVDGVLWGYHCGRRENFRTALLNADTLQSWHTLPYPIPALLFKLTQESFDKVAAIKQALSGMPDEERQRILDQALRSAVGGYNSKEPFISLLLEAGAKADAEVGESKGYTLALAIRGRSPALVKLLVDQGGAKFDDARTAMERGESWQWGRDDIARLEFYRETMTAKPPAEEFSPRVLGLLEHMQQQIDDLTKRQGSPAPAPKKPYPKIPSSPKKTAMTPRNF